MHYDINNFCNNENVYNYYLAKNPIDIAYVSARKLLNNKRNFRLVCYGVCNNYFIHKTTHTTLYCYDIYKDGKTYDTNELWKKYRNRYKNLNKQVSLSNNFKVFSSL